MKIMKLIRTVYIDDDNDLWDNLQDARENSIHPEDVEIIKRQRVKVEESKDNFGWVNVYSMKGVPLLILRVEIMGEYLEEIEDK